jgi:hypothetical protein
MSFAMLFRVREYLRGSVWFYPLAGAVFGVLLALLTKQADTSVTVPRSGSTPRRPRAPSWPRSSVPRWDWPGSW